MTRRTSAADTNPPTARRLHGIDHSLVAYEGRRGISAAIGLLARFDGVGPDESRLREHLTDRLATMPELRWILRKSRRGLAWHPDPNFDWATRILTNPPQHPSLRETVANIVNEPLDPTVSPWRVWLLRDSAPDQWALLFHVHHALADGLSMMSLAQRALGTQPIPRWPTRSWLTPDHPSRLRAWTTLVRDAPRQLWNLMPRRLSGAAVPTAHTIDWTSVDTAAARRLGHRHGATVNDVMLATIARALPNNGRKTLALIPVSIRTETERLGNEVAMFRVRLPADRRDPLKVLQAISAATTRAKTGPDVAVTRAGLRLLPQPVLNRILDLGLASRTVNLLISNWGSTPPLSFQDDPVRELVPIMFRPSGHPVTIGFATHAESTHIGLVAAGDTEPLRDATTAAFADLRGLDS